MIINALIPLRSKSKRIKNKNIQILKNKPLYKIVLDEALKSKLITNVFIATDDSNIKSYNKKMKIFSRSKKSATNKAQTEIVINEFLLKNNCDYLIVIQATNPFLKKEHLDRAIMKITKNKYDSLVSVVNTKFFIWKKIKTICKPLNYLLSKRPRSQDIKENQLIENGSFYIFKRKNFLKYNNRLHGKITYYTMPKESLFEIDEKEDLKIVRNILN
tara:strand:+ start:114 stop:761 length:648 start_codon:yes stop_codon:yes gene_type:complete